MEFQVCSVRPFCKNKMLFDLVYEVFVEWNYLSIIKERFDFLPESFVKNFGLNYDLNPNQIWFAYWQVFENWWKSKK